MPAEAAEAATTKEEGNFRQTAMSRWMAGLKESLPNPSLGAGSPDPEPDPEPDPDAPDPNAQVTPALAAPSASASASAAPPSAATVTPPAAAAPPAQAIPGPAAAKPSPVPAEPASDDRWPRSAKEWKNFTEKHKIKNAEFEKQIAEKDARIKQLETKAAAPVAPEVQTELDSLRKENDEFSKQLRLVAVTSHPRFKSHFSAKVNNTLAQLKGCVPADQVERVTALVQEPDSEAKNEQVNELLSEMTPLHQGRLIGVINSLASIQAEKDGEISKAQTDYDQMVAQAKTEQEQKQATFTKALADGIKWMQDAKTGRPEYQLRDGETEWNAAVQKRIEAGQKLITGNLPPEVLFKAAFDAAAYPDVLSGYRATLEENDKLRKQIASMTAANPKVQSPARAQPNGNEPALMPKDARPMDYTQRWVKRFGEAMRGEPG
jgi:hypothetical protein